MQRQHHQRSAFNTMLSLLVLLMFFADSASAHFWVRYPGWRGNTFKTQFHFPCGGLHRTTNRSMWPTNGGALSFVPGHAHGLVTVNIALGNDIDENPEAPANMFKHVMLPFFNQTGGDGFGTFCIPKLSIPKAIAPNVKNGTNATIQVIQLTPTGAALYNCMDITFSTEEANRFGVPKVWDEFCKNETLKDGTELGGLALGQKGPPITHTLVNSGLRVAAGSSLSLLVATSIASGLVFFL